MEARRAEINETLEFFLLVRGDEGGEGAGVDE